MKNMVLKGLLVSLVCLVCSSVFAHGNVTPQPVDTDGLEPLGKEWLSENPYRDSKANKKAIEIGASAYNQNCARCHGLDVISGGITPDLRGLNDPTDWDSVTEADEWFLMRIRNGAVIDGRVYMPPFEKVMNQEAMWAIRTYIESRGQID